MATTGPVVRSTHRTLSAVLQRRFLLLLLAGAISACGSSTPTSLAASRVPTTSATPTAALREISGLLSINVQSVDDYDLVPPDRLRNCEGAGSFADLRVGSEVEVRDASAELIGLGRLQAGTMDWDGPRCQMPFGPIPVPLAPFYSFTFGRHDGPVFSDAELEVVDWTVDVSAGEPMKP